MRRLERRRAFYVACMGVLVHGDAAEPTVLDRLGLALELRPSEFHRKDGDNI
jgi:hypothetical protein